MDLLRLAVLRNDEGYVAEVRIVEQRRQREAEGLEVAVGLLLRCLVRCLVRRRHRYRTARRSYDVNPLRGLVRLLQGDGRGGMPLLVLCAGFVRPCAPRRGAQKREEGTSYTTL